LSNSLNSFFKEIYRDQFGEFVCGYWGPFYNLGSKGKNGWLPTVEAIHGGIDTE